MFGEYDSENLQLREICARREREVLCRGNKWQSCIFPEGSIEKGGRRSSALSATALRSRKGGQGVERAFRG